MIAVLSRPMAAVLAAISFGLLDAKYSLGRAARNLLTLSAGVRCECQAREHGREYRGKVCERTLLQATAC